MGIIIYASGLVSMSVCASVDMKKEDIEIEANSGNPAGHTLSWSIAEEEKFAGGEPMPCVCEQDETRQHWLLHC